MYFTIYMLINIKILEYYKNVCFRKILLYIWGVVLKEVISLSHISQSNEIHGSVIGLIVLTGTFLYLYLGKESILRKSLFFLLR